MYIYALFTSRSSFLILTKPQEEKEDEQEEGDGEKERREKRKQSIQSNNFKLLSMVNRTSFIVFKYESISTFSHLFFVFLNNDKFHL